MGSWLVVVSVLVSASCVQSSAVTCGELTCDEGAVCSPSGDACTLQAAIDVCTGQTDMAACTTPDDHPGACRDGYCQEVRCGDLRVDPGEACDDGNQASGDGCNADCSSDETCGNAVRDPGTEECDDGNVDSQDGCSASCRTEAPVWRESVDTSFHGREKHAMAYDAQRKRIVLFGGREANTSAALNETWEYDGDEWIKRSPATSPPARFAMSMAYDSTRHRIVMFGGVLEDATPLDDTWEWDGTNWTDTAPATHPSARSNAGMTFSPSRGVVVLAGGSVSGSTSSETWEYDGTDWTNRTNTAGTAPGKMLGPLAYDPGVGGVVAFNNNIGLGPPKTWKYDGTWTEVSVSSAQPRARNGYALVYDELVGHTVLIGGSGGGSPGDCGTYVYCSDAFELESDGSGGFQWTNVVAPFVPADGAAAYDADAQQLVVMGGRTSSFTPVDSATWFRGASGFWTLLSVPLPRSGCQMAYLPSLGGTVLFGGGGHTETWLFRDGRWSGVHPATSPPATDGTSLVLDRVRGKLVLVDVQSNTWEFDGTDWSKITTAHAPPARESFRLAYDESRSAVILFGGSVPKSTGPRNDTWSYDGTDWTELTPTTSPTPRLAFAMTYDRSRNAVVVFGDGTTNDSDTWELTGSGWTMTSATGPTARIGTTLAYDARRGSSVLFGGANSQTTYLNDTWEYIGGAWRETTTAAPSARVGSCSAYDEGINKVIVFGGFDRILGILADTWLFGYE